MKKYFILLSILLVLPSILAVNINVNQTSSDKSMVLGLNEPTTFNLDIQNNGPSDNFIIYTFFGSNYLPKERFYIGHGETKEVNFTIYPSPDSSRTGFIFFDYFIKGSDGSQYDGQLTVKLVDLNEAFKIGSMKINPESNSLEIYIQNKISFNFSSLKVNFSSAFFNLNKTFSLGPKEIKKFEVTLNKEDFKKLSAGNYNLNAKVLAENKTANIDGIINFEKKSIITTNVSKYGFIIRTKVTKKSNEGNVADIVQVNIQKDIISRLFTSITPSPDSVKREGFDINYTWNKNLNPGDVLEIRVKTNWFLPLIFIILIVAVVLFAKEYTKTDLKLRKKITFIKSKGGEFALKVSLVIDAKKTLDNVLIMEKLPSLLKLYEKFGKEKPTKINAKGKRVEWEFKKLEAGERRLISYIVYSKVGVLGKFALPKTSAIFEKDGKIGKSQSNRVFFLAEQKVEKEE